EEWPHFAFRRRAYRNRPLWGHEMPAGAYEKVLAQLRDEGPLTATELGGAKNGGEWWDWSASKVAVERALTYGDVVCVRRTG
ncbi:winged helix-turn-helix domain-containing protein, partial [Streptomyces sp. SID11233]|nr:winged helix-turn-helix domain-containing protein [Streptomyces sp. SID11233]